MYHHICCTLYIHVIFLDEDTLMFPHSVPSQSPLKNLSVINRATSCRYSVTLHQGANTVVIPNILKPFGIYHHHRWPEILLCHFGFTFRVFSQNNYLAMGTHLLMAAQEGKQKNGMKGKKGES